MPNKLTISRRDFLNGVAIGTVGAGCLSPLDLLARGHGSGNYPPARTGMRGSHAGSFEVAHEVAWKGAIFPRPRSLTDDVYDLVVVGGGISGLAAAYFFRQRRESAGKVLIIDNHDDFGGHAKRNEFNVDGRTLIGYGGSQSIDGPARYSAAAKQLLADVGIETQRFYDYFDREFSARHGLRRAIYFDPAVYGRRVTAANVFRGWDGAAADDLEQTIASYPVREQSRQALLRLLTERKDYRPDLSRSEKIDFLRSISYTRFLRESVDIPREVTDILCDQILGLWGVGWDALSALEACRDGMPATQDMGIGELGEPDHGRDEPYIFHFPDGNAGIARSLVRRLIPGAVPGDGMEGLVTARVDYDRLDRRGSPVRIRLNSTAVDIRHTSDGRHVDVTYVNGGDVHRVRGRHVVFAGYNAMLPHICSELPEAQTEALGYAEKVPLVYYSIAVRNWRAFSDMGYGSFYIPKSKYLYSFGLDFPVSIGDYRFTSDANEPTVIHGTWVPHSPESGLPAREQHAAGQQQLYEMSFADFESDIVAKLSGALEPGGFDAERDIAAITVNRWPHGYAYEYNDLSDPVGFSPANGPHVAGRSQIGRISIANSDAAGYAYANGAIDAADRAITEQINFA